MNNDIIGISQWQDQTQEETRQKILILQGLWGEWKDGDIGHGSLRSYAPKQREFLEFCKNNCPGLIRTEAAQNELVEALNIAVERAHVAFLDLDALQLSGFAGWEHIWQRLLWDVSLSIQKVL